MKGVAGGTGLLRGWRLDFVLRGCGGGMVDAGREMGVALLVDMTTHGLLLTRRNTQASAQLFQLQLPIILDQ